jgi:chemotaxis protein methyltransferase WspC
MVSLPDCEHQATVDGEAGPPDVSSSDLEPIVALLRAKIGLEPGSVGAAWLASRVRARMEVTKVDSVARYSELASTSPDELAELAEEVVIPETWFFRDETPFQLFARYVVSEWLPLHGGRPLRVLSVPCASGEEPYSIAIVLLDAGLRPDQLRIDAESSSGCGRGTSREWPRASE